MAAGKAFLATAVLLGVLWCVLAYNNRPPDIVIPTPKLPNPNGYDALLKAAKLFPMRPGSVGPLSDTHPKDWWTRERYEEFMEQNAAGLAAVRQAMLLPYQHPADRSFYTQSMHNNASFREIARRLGGEAMYFEFVGDSGKAAEAGLDVLQIGVRLPQGGVLISMLVGNAIEGIGLYSFAYLIPHLHPQKLASVADRLDRVERLRPPYSDVVLEEGYAVVGSMEEELHKDHGKPQWSDLCSVFGPWMTIPEGVEACRWALANKQRMLQQALDYYLETSRSMRGPYAPGLPAHPPRNLLLDGTDDLIRRCWATHTRQRTVIALLQAEVAIRRFKGERGRFPDRLEEVVPAYLKSVPVDPFGREKPLIYRPTDNGKSFLLYSRGFDMKDDGGKESAKPRDPDLKGDMFLMGLVGRPWD